MSADGDGEAASGAECVQPAASAAAAAAGVDKGGWTWREPADSLLWLAACGIAGTLARMGLVHLFACYSTASGAPAWRASTFCRTVLTHARAIILRAAGAACRSLDESALFVTLAANMVGCFVAGLLGTPASVGVPPDTRDSGAALACVPAAHRVQRCG
jgi:hypothetical protein